MTTTKFLKDSIIAKAQIKDRIQELKIRLDEYESDLCREIDEICFQYNNAIHEDEDGLLDPKKKVRFEQRQNPFYLKECRLKVFPKSFYDECLELQDLFSIQILDLNEKPLDMKIYLKSSNQLKSGDFAKISVTSENKIDGTEVRLLRLHAISVSGKSESLEVQKYTRISEYEINAEFIVQQIGESFIHVWLGTLKISGSPIPIKVFDHDKKKIISKRKSQPISFKSFLFDHCKSPSVPSKLNKWKTKDPLNTTPQIEVNNNEELLEKLTNSAPPINPVVIQPLNLDDSYTKLKDLLKDNLTTPKPPTLADFVKGKNASKDLKKPPWVQTSILWKRKIISGTHLIRISRGRVIVGSSEGPSFVALDSEGKRTIPISLPRKLTNNVDITSVQGGFAIKDNSGIFLYDENLKLKYQISKHLKRYSGLTFDGENCFITLESKGRFSEVIFIDMTTGVITLRCQLCDMIPKENSSNYKFKLLHYKNGNIYILEMISKKVYIMDDNSFVSRTFGGFGSNYGNFQDPNSIETCSRGNILISDFKANRIQIFDKKRRFLAKVRVDGHLQRPLSVIINDSTMEIFILKANLLTKLKIVK